MSYTCTTLGSVSRLGSFDWYIFLLQDGLSDGLRDEIERNFDLLGRALGEPSVIIRGYDPQRLRREVQEAYAAMYSHLGGVSPPALFVTDLAPGRLHEPNVGGRFMVFPLRGFRQTNGSVADFLSSLAESLSDPEAVEALKESRSGRFERCWQWVARYLVLRPSFMGFGARLDVVGEDAARCLDRWFPVETGSG